MNSLTVDGDELAQGLLAVDADGRIVGWNRTFARAFDLVDETEPPATAARLARRLAERGTLGERASRAMARRLFAVDTRARLFRLRNDRVLRAVVTPRPAGGRLVSVEDVTERWISERESAFLAARDVLTGLANRRLFHDRLERALAHGERHGSDVAILYLDLDRFKLVNDTLGHPVGDALLRAVAGRLRTAVRATDTVARFGGDEFGVLTAPAPGTAELGEQAARLVTVLSGTYLVEGHTVDVGASVGIAVGRGSVERLEREADIALYRAKRDGRGCWRRFEPTMAKTLRRRRDLETDLRRALPLRQFEVHYQPQLDVTGGAVSGFEALVRWRHPDRGFMGPDAFIPLAEETGLINDIGGWVLTEACREAASWHDPVPIAVNLSPVEFHNPKLVPQVEKALRLSGLPPERLILEITESALLRDSANVSALLQQLQDVGLKIAMDDFGIGYSSLSYLCRFHFDKIKLDKSFIQAIGEDRRAGAIIDAVARLASDLGMTTIAEGVETAGQLRHLEQLGYSAVQGFLIGRPMPATDLAGFLARGAAGVVAADDRRTRATSLTRTSHEHHAPSLALL